MTPNMVTAIGAALCVYATYLFAYGHYWTGMLAAFIFMVLDTVDGKLARCTIRSEEHTSELQSLMRISYAVFCLKKKKKKQKTTKIYINKTRKYSTKLNAINKIIKC